MSKKRDRIKASPVQDIYAMDKSALQRLGLNVSELGPKVIANLHNILGQKHASAKDRNTAIGNWVKIQQLNLAAMRLDKGIDEDTQDVEVHVTVLEDGKDIACNAPSTSPDSMAGSEISSTPPNDTV